MRAAIITLIGLLASCTPYSAAESTYCAFEVKVTSASGTPRAKVPVQLVRGHTTSLLETSTGANGIARLCDSPLEAVDIAVGSDVCGLVTVRNLHSMWPQTKQVFVTFEEYPCDHFALSEYVQVLLRIQDQAGRPVAGARFEGGTPMTGSGSEVSDDLGRLFRLVKRQERLRGVIQGASGERAPVSVLCSDDVELKIGLHKRP